MSDQERTRADWDDIRSFVAAAQTGSFGAAARRLRISQPTVTRRIDDLETRLGARLFDRGLRGVTLTRAGEMVYDRALSMQRASVDIERLALESNSPEAGEVAIAAPEGLGGYFLGPEIADFLRENPAIRLALDCGFYPQHPVDRHVDLCLQIGDVETTAEVNAVPLATLHYGLFASRDYLETYGAPTRLDAAAGHRFVAHVAQNPIGTGRTTEAFFALNGPALVVNSSTAMLHALQRGAGIGVIPTAILSVAPDLVMLDIPPLASSTLWLTHHRDAMKSTRVARVATWLTALFDAREKPWFRPDFVHPTEFAGWSWPAATGRA
jgi:DNA-binding transcriptional LysR family regulator